MVETQSPKKKMGLFKKLLLAAVILFGLVAVAGAVVPFFIDWNWVKDQAAVALSKQIHHKTTIESATFNLFTGVSLKNVRIENAAGYSKEPLFSNDNAVVKYSLWMSLAAHKLMLSKVEFIAPRVLIEKGVGGAYNFSDMFPSARSARSGSAREPEASSSQGSTAFPVNVAALAISKGSFTYRDRATGKTTAVSNLDMELTGFSLTDAGQSRLKVAFNGEVEGKKIPVELDALFSINFGEDSLRLSKADLHLPGLAINAEGSLLKLTSAPQADLKLDLKAVLDNLVADLVPPSMLKSFPPGLKTRGKINLAAQLKGALSNLASLKASGKTTFDSVGIAYGDYPALDKLNGDLNFDNTHLDMPGLRFNMGGQPVELALSVSDFNLAELSGPLASLKARVRYKLTSPRLVLDPLLALSGPELSEAEEAKADAAPEPPPVQLGRTVPPGLRLDGKVEVGSLQLGKTLTGKLSQSIILERQQARVDLSLDAFHGNLTTQVNANLAVPGTTYGFLAKINGLRVEEAVDAYAGLKPKKKWLQELRGKVFGALATSVRGTGKGLNGKAIKRNLDASGHFKLSQGKLSRLAMLEKVAASIPHPATAAALRKDINFDRLESDFTMKAGRITWPNLAMDSGPDGRAGDLMLQSHGFMKPSAQVEIYLIPHFNPRVTQVQGGTLQEYFQDDKGWITYDSIVYAGPSMSEAKADFTQGLKNAANRAVQKQTDALKQKAGDLLKEKGGDLLKNLPGGLFGK